MTLKTLLTLLLVLLTTGCREKNRVTGRVFFEGKPVTQGSVTVVGSDGTTRYGQIASDGAFSIEAVPPGPAKFAVHSVDPASPEDLAELKEKYALLGSPPPIDPNAGNCFPIPEVYGDLATSGLIATIGTGVTAHDIQLRKKD